MAEDEAPLLASSPGTPTRHSFEWPRPQLPNRKRSWTWPSRKRFLLLIGLTTLCLAISAFVYHGLAIHPSPARAADLKWIASSDSVFDRFTCRWVGVCGLVHWWLYSEPSSLGRPEDLETPAPDYSGAWIDLQAGEHPEESWSAQERTERTVPDYVFDYAPFVFLHDEERYWPSDPAEHLFHSHIQTKASQIEIPANISLSNLGQLNGYENSDGRRSVSLISIDDPEERPEWMLSRQNRPGFNTSGAEDRSSAPAVLVCVSKPDGVLDAFFFFFYSFNEGNTVFGTRYGNHVGDWEHTLVRFRDGKPQALYLSRHAWGSAYNYEAIDKIGVRPVVFAGNGSHAHYPTAGDQPYVLPFGILKDVTARAVRWDPTLNLFVYIYTPPDRLQDGERTSAGSFRAALQNPRAPTSWLDYMGYWGDEQYALSDLRQYRFFGETHFGNGPTGPRDKRLDRKDVCDTGKCHLQDVI